MRVTILTTILAVMMLPSCTSTSRAPVDNRSTTGPAGGAPVIGGSYAPEPVTRGYHTVAAGETLYAIAWRYGLDYRDIARWNRIGGKYVIFPGQRLLLTGPARTTSTTTVERPAAPPKPAASASTPRPAPAPRAATPPPAIAPANAYINWRWPTLGKLIKSSTPIAQNGIDISGREGQDIVAAANGVVVYSGSGLLGYGKLIIVKHNDTYLSAYAHNREILVREGDNVSAGQKIATMGRVNRGEPLLHFEIRKDGKPVNPLGYLPANS